MHWPDGYALLKVLRATARGETQLATRESDGCDVVLKRYSADRAGERDSRARREFEALQTVAGAGTPGAYALVPGAPPVLVIEYIAGSSLDEWRDLHPAPTPLQFLEIAIQLTEILKRVHAAHLLHLDVTPSNVVVRGTDLVTYLIDFGMARTLGASSSPSSPSAPSSDKAIGPLIGATAMLQYVSPEQTGRMNRGVDARSDLYSLGATFHFLLTGKPPFDATDPLALIHAHMARTPTSPHLLEPSIPEALSRVVMKLLQKEPAERYQTASALCTDLRELHTRWARGDPLDADFDLGGAETPHGPRFPAKLYGRDQEIDRLRTRFEESAAGSIRIAVISGEPGTGKSAIVDELRSSLAARGGYLAIGKFDLYQDRPYAGWAAALGSIAQQLLLEPDARLAHWRDVLRAALGNVAQALVDVVPDLQFVLGDVPTIPTLGPRETQARLSLALQRFLSAFATPEHPIVLFLDDLQWSDAGSRALFEGLVTTDASPALLLVGAYRHEEVDVDHPLRALFARLERLGVNFDLMQLAPLSAAAVACMLADALGRSIEDAQPLAELVERKTANVPLLVQRFVEHLHANGLLQYQRGAGWRWDSAAVAGCDITDGAVGLMSAKIERLEPEARALLEFASCIGSEFDAPLLCQLGRRERDRVEASLFALSHAGLIAPSPGGFRFVHDRIREAAYLLLSEEERARVHHETARRLLDACSEEERKQRVFEIVEHQNRSLGLLSGELRVSALELNLLAASRALDSGVAATAESYLSVARELLCEEDWNERAATSFGVLLLSSETAFQAARFEFALSLLDQLERRRALTPLEFAQVAMKRLQVLALTQETEPCVRYVLDVLARFGVRWPMHPSNLRAWFEIRWVRWLLRGRIGPHLFRPAEEVGPEWRALLIVLNGSGGIMSRVDARLRLLGSCLLMRRYLSQGYATSPGFVLAAFTTYAYWFIGAAADPMRSIQCALDWNERVPDPVSGPRTEMIAHTLVQPWLLRRRDALAPLDLVAERSREVGDREYEYYTRFLACTYRMLAGEHVARAEEELRTLADSVERSGHWFPEPDAVHRAYRQLVAEELTDLDLERELAASEAWLATGTSSADVYMRTCWMLVLCVHNRHDLAFAQSEAIRERLFRVVPYIHVADHTFYRGLAAGTLAVHARGTDRRRYRRALRSTTRQLRRWSRSGPDFLHMVWLLEAEALHIRGHFARARDRYQQAAQRAKLSDFVHHAALAHERRARMLYAQRRETDAATALAEAAASYAQWGALAKASALEQEHQRLLGG